MSGFEALEETGDEVDFDVDVVREFVEERVALHADCVVEEEEPSAPGSVLFFVGRFGFGVEDAVGGATIEKTQEEISLGRGAMQKFMGICSG